MKRRILYRGDMCPQVMMISVYPIWWSTVLYTTLSLTSGRTWWTFVYEYLLKKSTNQESFTFVMWYQDCQQWFHWLIMNSSGH